MSEQLVTIPGGFVDQVTISFHPPVASQDFFVFFFVPSHKKEGTLVTGSADAATVFFIEKNISSDETIMPPQDPELISWLRLSESAFEFWDNEDDAYFDNL